MAAQLYTDWAPGPQSQPLVNRSKYLADALKNLEAQSTAPQSGGELASRLLAEALLSYGDKRNDKALRVAQQADISTEQAQMLASLGGGATPAPQATALANAIQPPPPAPAAMPAPQQVAPPQPASPPVQSAPIPPAQPNPLNGIDSLTGMGARITSGLRTPAHNAAVGGVPNSYHLTDQARDLVPPQGMTMAQLEQAARSNVPGGKVLNEGNHVHVQWGAPSTQAPPMPPQAPPMPPQQSPPQPMQAQAASGPAAPTAPAKEQMVPGQDQTGATPQEIALIQRAYASGNPQQVEFARQLAQRIQMRIAEPPKFDVQVTRAGQVVRTDPQTGEIHVTDVPGFRQQLSNNMAYGADGAAHQIKGTETHNATAQELGINAPPGTVFSVDPSGKATPLYQPPAGYQSAGANGALAPQQNGPASPTSPQNIVTNEGKLRDDYDRDMKDYNTARQAYQRLQTAAHDNTGASDIALVYNFMRTLDPTSTVREGEFATAQNSGSIPQSVMNAYNKAIKGERLQPEQRQGFVQTGSHQFQAYLERANQLNQRYSGIANSYGFDPSRIVQPVTMPGLPANLAPDGNGNPGSGGPAGGSGGVGSVQPSPAYQAALAEKARRDAARRGGR